LYNPIMLKHLKRWVYKEARGRNKARLNTLDA